MVPDTGKTPGTDTYKLVNAPEPVKVEEDAAGLPLAVKLRRRQAIASIEDRWRIDDEWWRSEAVSRLYYAVVLASGQRLTLFKDLIAGGWFRQAY